MKPDIWHRCRRRTATGLAAATALAGFAVVAPPADAASTPTSATGVLSAVSGSAATGTWAVGNLSMSTGPTPLIEQLSGGAWHMVPAQVVGKFDSFFGVASISSTNAWAVGQYFANAEEPLVEHWNGSAWSAVVVPLPKYTTGAYLEAVSAASSGSVWAVGQYTTPGGTFGLVDHFNGKTWSAQTVPLPFTANSASLAGVDAIAPDDVWAVGDQTTSQGGYTEKTLTEHWNGTTWVDVLSPNTPNASDTNLNAVAAISPDDIWAVGASLASGLSALAEHWNGTSWSIEPIPGVPNEGGILMSLAPSSDGGMWAVGYSTVTGSGPSSLVEKLTGSTWNIVPSPNPPGAYGFLRGISTAGASPLAVGQGYTTSYQDTTLAEQYVNGAWTLMDTPSS